jgi:hypothetical protein
MLSVDIPKLGTERIAAREGTRLVIQKSGRNAPHDKEKVGQQFKF